MLLWDERACHQLVVEICDDSLPRGQREAAWRALLVRVAPHIEAWAQSSPVLRRCGLTSADEARSVLVGVLSRLSARSFENLRAYLARRRAPEEDEEETALVEGVARLAGDEEDPGAPAREDEGTPLCGWLRMSTRYAVKDHLKQRFGWTSSVRARYGLSRRTAGARREALEQGVRAVPGVLAADLDERAGILEIEYLPGTVRPDHLEAAIETAGFEVSARPDLRRSKRDLVTGAERFGAITEPGERPPITDALALGRLLDDVSAYMRSFPEPMGKAVRLWLDDEPFDAIAAQLGLDGPERSRALVRAGVGRLRERFRGRWPAVFEGRA